VDWGGGGTCRDKAAANLIGKQYKKRTRLLSALEKTRATGVVSHKRRAITVHYGGRDREARRKGGNGEGNVLH